MNLRTSVRKFVVAQGLLQPGDRVVVGVSGGPDSLCLLDLLYAWCQPTARDSVGWDLAIHVAYLNHGLRPEAAAEAAFVQAQAEARDLSFYTETVDTRAYALAHKKSIEEAARALRYAFLIRVAQSVAASVIAVAHTADDQAETVLMHFLRGSGLAGLRGMLPKLEVGRRRCGGKLEAPQAGQKLPEAGSNPRPAYVTSDLRLANGASDPPTAPPTSSLCLIRPLLNTPRAEVEAYCTQHHLQPVQDVTNQDPAYLRNRLRRELLPELERYNPNIRSVLGRAADVIAGEYEMLRRSVDQLWKEIARMDRQRVTFDRKGWQALGVAEQRALLRKAVATLRPPRPDALSRFTPLDSAVRFSRVAAPGRSCDLLGGLRLAISADHLTVGAWGDEAPTPEHLPLVGADGRLTGGWRLCAETLDPGEWSPDQAKSGSSDWRVFVDAAHIRAPLQVRARRPGDRFCPLGMEGRSLKISDFMINAKVEASLRGRWPIVVTGDEIMWVAGMRLDERFKITGATEKAMRLEFVKNDPQVQPVD